MQVMARACPSGRLSGMHTEGSVVDGELYRRYQVSGPRYTSYPAANRFREDFDAGDWTRAARASNNDPIPPPLSIYVHVPFCSSPCFYCACNRVITRRPEAAGQYLLRLKREIAMQAALFDPDREVVQVHFGGGTPSTLGCAGLGEVMETLSRHFRFAGSSAREFGIELDPRYVDTGMMEFLAGLGFNRVSFGVQDFDPAVQRAVNRIQSPEETFALLDAARANDFHAINLDLICGLPLQTQAGFGRTLDQVIDHRPDRVAMYSYAHLPGMFKPQRRIDESELPRLDDKLALLRMADEKLLDAGYVMIGMDHYALPEDPLAVALDAGTLQRNFQGYATHDECDLVGLGVSSIGMLGDVYAQNARGLLDYYATIDSGRLAIERGVVLSADDHLRREIIHTLLCSGTVAYEQLEQRHRIDFREYFADELVRLERLARDGLVELDEAGFRLLPAARPVMRVVAMIFDAYLAEDLGDYSRVV